MRTFDPEGEEGERLTAYACIVLNTGVRIARTKGNNINAYYLDDEEFTKVGRGGPPEPILDILGQLELPFGKDLVPCIAMQDELPFAVFESAPNKGSLLNYLTGVDIGDKMRKDINKEARRRNTEIKRNLDSIEQIEAELEKYPDLDAMHERMEKGQIIERRIEGYAKEIYKLFKVENAAKSINAKIKHGTHSVKCLERTIEVGDNLIATWKAVRLLETLKGMQGASKHIKASEGLLMVAEDASKQCVKYCALIKQANSVFEQVEDIEDDILEAKSQIKSLEKELAKYEECDKCAGTGVICHG